jgi:DNA-binding MurR/RpiR family transcriptional regulator
MTDQPLSERIARLERLTNSESKILELLEESWPLTALETLTSISEKAGVGKATVVRFIARLGYDNFQDFQEQMRRELIYRIESPYRYYSDRKTRLPSGVEDFFGQYVGHVSGSLQDAHARLNPDLLKEAARTLADCPGTLFVAGQGESHAMAYLFWNQAMYLRDRVHLLEHLNVSLPHQLINVSEKDALLAIARRRYGHQTHNLCRWFSSRGAKVVLLTDRDYTPSSELADIQLVVRAEGPAMFNSNCPRLTVLETMVWMMTHYLEKEFAHRSEVCEELFQEFSIFVPWNYGLRVSAWTGEEQAEPRKEEVEDE